MGKLMLKKKIKILQELDIFYYGHPINEYEQESLTKFELEEGLWTF